MLIFFLFVVVDYIKEQFESYIILKLYDGVPLLVLFIYNHN